MYFPLFPAPPRLQLVLYSNEEVRAALQPLWAIPAFTDLLLTDPPAAPKQKRDKPAGDPVAASAQHSHKEGGRWRGAIAGGGQARRG